MANSTARYRVTIFSVIFIFVLGFFMYLSPSRKTLSHAAESQTVTAQPKPRKPNGVIFMLISPSRITQATMALLNVEDRFNRRLKYPYVLFSPSGEADVITEELRAKVRWITEGRATFAIIPKEMWDVPEFLDKSRIDQSLRKIGFTLGFFWRHPALARYDWLWRLDTDIEFHCDVPYDPIEKLVENNALYGFVQISPDGTWVQPTLASNVSRFIADNERLVPADANLGFSWKGAAGIEKARSGIATSDDWTLMCMYNNFEISHRSVWESETYTKFFEYLDKEGGLYYERWGDAPIHSYGLALSLRKNQVYKLPNLGYQHQKWPYECPELDRCACVKEDVSRDFNDHKDSWFNPEA
ncbi:nucleotide-diphospho-sugar transferase [Crucibulum laeve]|uniref:Nucleotide-diphospho-sugar transferase n=1 Tax=Crucibulum laeve TaxID=68775 RepID=A0A5C3LMA8_9AGAR|nr:nucleotide-diphospho-sugar transferase [Crucibulum laeve]